MAKLCCCLTSSKSFFTNMALGVNNMLHTEYESKVGTDKLFAKNK